MNTATEQQEKPDPVTERFLKGSGVGLAAALQVAKEEGKLPIAPPKNDASQPTEGVTGVETTNEQASSAGAVEKSAPPSTEELLMDELKNFAERTVAELPLGDAAAPTAASKDEADETPPTVDALQDAPSGGAPADESSETEELELDLDQFAGIICDLDEATKKALIAKVRAREHLGPVAVEPAASSEKAPAPERESAPKKEVVTITLGQFARMDLVAKLAAAPEKEHRLELRGKDSLLTLSVALTRDKDGGRHVRLKALSVTGEFTKDFHVGFRFDQAEVFGLVDVRDSIRRKSTEALRKVIAGIERGIRERYEERKNAPRDRRPHRGNERREVKAQTAK